MALLHWWNFNNSVADRGMNQKDMIAEQSPTFQTGGKTTLYSARYSNSDHYIDNDITNCDELSMAMWVKLDSSQDGWGQIFTINDWGTSWNNIKMGFDNQTNTRVWFTISDGTNNASYKIGSNNNLQDNTWHHVVGTYKKRIEDRKSVV